MKVTVSMGGKERIVTLEREGTVGDLLDALGLFPDAHIVMRDGTAIPITERVKEGENFRLLKVASGG
ncbi:MAG: thiamine biosynthesis protein ThiS [Methanomassiliicoccales archaeon]